MEFKMFSVCQNCFEEMLILLYDHLEAVVVEL